MKFFIPKQYESEPVTIRMRMDKLRKIDRLVAENNLSRSGFINQCIDFAVEHMQDKPQDESEDNSDG